MCDPNQNRNRNRTMDMDALNMDTMDMDAIAIAPITRHVHGTYGPDFHHTCRLGRGLATIG
jgi:hypothetical protein